MTIGERNFQAPPDDGWRSEHHGSVPLPMNDSVRTKLLSHIRGRLANMLLAGLFILRVCFDRLEHQKSDTTSLPARVPNPDQVLAWIDSETY